MLNKYENLDTEFWSRESLGFFRKSVKILLSEICSQQEKFCEKGEKQKIE